MAELNVKELAAYIQKKHLREKQKNISPIKLQKSLYFLFAYWGGIVRKSRLYPSIVEENYGDFDEILFNDNIEAWVYGPVVPVVYRETNIANFYNVNMFNGKEKLKEFIDGLLEEIFEVNDFTLVNISHNDKAWKNNFSYQDSIHDYIIPKEEIIREYATK